MFQCEETRGPSFIVFAFTSLLTLFLVFSRHPARHSTTPCSLNRPSPLKSTRQWVADAAATFSKGTFWPSEDGNRTTWESFDISLSTSSNFSRAVHILLLGDSVDRLMLHDVCTRLGSSIREWAPETFAYKWGGTFRCDTEWGSLTFVHFYGVHPVGPYFSGYVNTQSDPYVDTELRIPKVFERYSEVFGSDPDVVVYQSFLWDIYMWNARGSETSMPPERIKFLAGEYERQFEANVDSILSLVAPRAILLLRTTPAPARSQLVPEYNSIVRDIGRRRVLPVLDWDTIIRGEAWKGIMRDDIHPSEKYSESFGQSMVQFCRVAVDFS